MSLMFGIILYIDFVLLMSLQLFSHSLQFVVGS